MGPLMRPILAVAASVALTVSLAVAYPAQAATYTPLGERSLAGSSLGAGDVPRWMSHGTRSEPQLTFRRGAAAGAPELCVDRNGDAIQGRQARQSMQSKVVTRVTRIGSTDVDSLIFQYRTRAAAERAWTHLSANAARCEGRTEVNGEGEGVTTRGVVTAEVAHTRPLFGTPGITILVDFDLVYAFDTEFALIGHAYTTYYLAGMSIISVTFGSDDGVSRGVGRVSRGFVDTMSIVIAQRVERRTLG